MYEDVKKEILDICLQMVENDLVIGSSGNVSVRVGNHVVITPSSVWYTEMSFEDMVVIDLTGNVIEGKRNPSVEWQMHLALYAERPDAVTVIHTHSIYASVMAIKHEFLPPIIDETVPKLGSDVKVTKYHMPGTKDLGLAVVETIKDRSAALIANHGAVCIAKTLKKALHLAIVLERTCKIYTIARMSGGSVYQLPEEVVEDEQDLWEVMSGY
jgi:L-fuculose-phosphate aldolase